MHLWLAPDQGSTRPFNPLLIAAIFLSALLLFLLQPMVAKSILPWFGGGAGVWTTTMLFFQLVLLAGYLYAHVLTRFQHQAAIHVGLLALSALLLPVAPSAAWKPNGTEDPTLQIIGLLLTSFGLPFMLLSATSPLLSSWFALPYRVFAISNLGSLVALLAYPFAIEPWAGTALQLKVWSGGYAIFGILLAVAAIGGASLSPRRASVRTSQPIWLALAACPSILWLAISNHLSQDVASVPFLWIVPLGIYLLSFILCFDRDGWYRPRLYRWLLPPAWIGMGLAFSFQGNLGLIGSLAIFGVALFICCMFCHGELASRKPGPEGVTGYYLTVAAGGALGGIFVGAIAPRVFTEFLELPIGIVACILLTLSGKRMARMAITAVVAVVAALTIRGNSEGQILQARNFYGILQVSDSGTADLAYRSLYNGTIQHGIQWIHAAKSRIPTTYYGIRSGAGMAINYKRPRPQRVGVVGLGAGTLAVYGMKGDVYRFYEINPVVTEIAKSRFRYLSESGAGIEIIPGDARLALEREAPQGFDVLAIDAFSGDSIPVHLLTREAYRQYWRHLKPNGVLAVHVTNKYVDLAGVVKALAEDDKKPAILINNPREDEWKVYYSSWILITANQELATALNKYARPFKAGKTIKPWTDDYSNLLKVLR